MVKLRPLPPKQKTLHNKPALLPFSLFKLNHQMVVIIFPTDSQTHAPPSTHTHTHTQTQIHVGTHANTDTQTHTEEKEEHNKEKKEKRGKRITESIILTNLTNSI